MNCCVVWRRVGIIFFFPILLMLLFAFWFIGDESLKEGWGMMMKLLRCLWNGYCPIHERKVI